MGRWRTVGQRWSTVVAVALAILAVIGPVQHSALAQNPPGSDAWHAVVDTDRVNIHSGRAEQFEKIGTLKKGDVVLVKSINTFGWAAVAPPPGLTGFVARQDVADGEKAGTVRALGRVPVLYPISEDPAQCFRKSRIEPDTILHVLGEVPTAESGVFLKVDMPEQVDVYVLAQFLRKATDEEIAAWKKKLKEDAAKAEPDAPAPTTPQGEPDEQPQAQPEAAPVEQPSQPEQAQPEPVQPEPQPEIEQPAPEPVVEAAPAEEQQATQQPVEQPAAPEEEEKEKEIEATLPNLEQLYAEMTKVAILDAEIEPLLRSYEAFAAKTEKKGEKRVAEIRIDLLKIRLDQQNAMRKLKNAARAASEPVVVKRVEIWRDEAGRPVFTAQGRLASSNVFDGRRLPLLYRIQDELTGRTIAYLSVKPENRLDVERRLNLNVGVIGDAVQDPGLRIDVIEVKRIVDLDEGE
ncbi:MAG: hypothetical protein IT430_09635 [Phycisphaerales bacterium]|nr:hypothetical protein [Phycisphaerales bacterium]